MKSTVGWLVIAAAPLLTATPASAWHRSCYGGYAAPAMPMMPMMPMMGMGAMPMMGMGAMPIMPAMTMPILPALSLPTVTAQGGMSLSMSMSGDLTAAMVAAGLLRNLVGGFLGVPGAANNAEAQAATLARQLVAALQSSGATMNAAQANEIISRLATLNDQMSRALNDKGVFTPPKAPGGAAPPKPAAGANQEAERARAEIRKMVAQAAAKKPQQAVSAEQARANIRQMVAAQRARTSTGAASDAERARAEIRQMVADAKARRARGNPPAATTVARDAK